MGQPSRKTPNRVSRMLELHKSGASAREIAEGLGIKSHKTVVRWLHDMGLEPNGGNGSRDGRRRAPPNGVAGSMTEAQKHLAQLTDGPVPKDYAGVLDRLRANFAMVAGLVEFHVKAAKTGGSTMGELEKALAIQDKFAVKIKELTPPDAGDPEDHPDNAEAAQKVMERIFGAVQEARGRARCVHCGRNPHG